MDAPVSTMDRSTLRNVSDLTPDGASEVIPLPEDDPGPNTQDLRSLVRQRDDLDLETRAPYHLCEHAPARR